MPGGVTSADAPPTPDGWSPGSAGDALTRYVWLPTGDRLQRWSSGIGLGGTPLAAACAIAGVLAFLLFWRGDDGLGLLAAVAFLVIAIASEPRSWVGWGLALLPLCWWWAWSHGLQASDHPLAPVYGLMVLWAVVGGSAADAAIALIFRRRSAGVRLDDWQKFDSSFALVAAAPSINVLLLGLGWVIGRPAAALVALAWWIIVTVIVHGVRLAQASERKARGEAIAARRPQ